MSVSLSAASRGAAGAGRPSVRDASSRSGPCDADVTSYGG